MEENFFKRCRERLMALRDRLPRHEASPHVLTTSIFLKALGIIYLIAFSSLGAQILGLVGSGGILPAAGYLQILQKYAGEGRFWLAPTLFWLHPTDGFLRFLCYGGAGLSVLMICDVAPALVLSLLWMFYLSLTSVCRDFMMFQWDILLLETGFLAIFLAPLRLLPARSRDPDPEPAAVWLVRWLLFRLTFGSGVVKLTSGDASWRNLTALSYHYQTQPLPTWIGWYAHQLPLSLQKACAFEMFGLELLVPFLFLCPRRFRQVGCALTIMFQLLIMATGNYCFFNLLTIALCIMLLDDAVWPEVLQAVIPTEVGIQKPGFPLTTAGMTEPKAGRRWPKWVIAPLAALIILLSGVEMLGTFRVYAPWMNSVMGLSGLLSPFHIVNGYGLFAVMTTSRPEIIIEGSNDQQNWLAYEFKYKPGDLARRPAFVEPHQPRLDWQMWFAALGGYRDNMWFISLCSHILKGSPEVLALLEKNPFPAAPPHYLRALVYEYCFNNLETRRATGNWWSRQLKGIYCPVLSLHPPTAPPVNDQPASSHGGVASR